MTIFNSFFLFYFFSLTLCLDLPKCTCGHLPNFMCLSLILLILIIITCLRIYQFKLIIWVYFCHSCWIKPDFFNMFFHIKPLVASILLSLSILISFHLLIHFLSVFNTDLEDIKNILDKFIFDLFISLSVWVEARQMIYF